MLQTTKNVRYKILHCNIYTQQTSDIFLSLFRISSSVDASRTSGLVLRLLACLTGPYMDHVTSCDLELKNGPQLSTPYHLDDFFGATYLWETSVTMLSSSYH